MITCAQCYKAIERSNPKFCHRCGYRVSEITAESARDAVPTWDSLMAMIANSGLPPEKQDGVRTKLEKLVCETLNTSVSQTVEPTQPTADEVFGLVLDDGPNE